MSTNFTFIDDAITIPYKSVQSSDSVTFSESIASFIIEPPFDSASFAEKVTLDVNLDLSDSALASDTVLSITFDSVDSATIQDFIGTFIITVPDETIHFTDKISISLVSEDSSSFADVATIEIFIEDSLTLSDFVNSIALRQSDEVAATDLVQSISTFVQSIDLDQTFIEFSGFIIADGPGLDHMHWNDEFDYQFIQTTLSSLDDPILSEDTPDISIPVVDSGDISEFISLALIAEDSLFITDTLSSLGISASSTDQFIYQEAFNLATDHSALDSLSFEDNRTLEASPIGVENIQLGESITITVSVADSGHLTEIVQNSLNSLDSINLIENKIIGAIASDVSILSDFVRINANATSKDSANLTESDNRISLIGLQRGILTEIPYYDADYARLDHLFLISEITSASILKEDDDQFFVSELTSAIALNGLQLITFKEKTGIGKAAPLVLNINDNSTVHGTATGDIISISVGGTEPVLL